MHTKTLAYGTAQWHKQEHLQMITTRKAENIPPKHPELTEGTRENSVFLFSHCFSQEKADHQL